MFVLVYISYGPYFSQTGMYIDLVLKALAACRNALHNTPLNRHDVVRVDFHVSQFSVPKTEAGLSKTGSGFVCRRI